MEIREDKNSIFQVNLFYLLMGLVLLTVGGFIMSKNILIGSLITSYILVYLTSLIYARIKGYNIRETFKLNKISPRQGFLSGLIVIFAYPLGIFINYLVLLLIGLFVELRTPSIPLPNTPSELWISLFVIALSPGICEEFMFRGLIMSVYDKLGKKKAILYSAFLFGIFHFNLQNFIGPFLLGIVFGIMVYKTNSIYPAMIGHTVNNGISMIISYFANNSMDIMENMDMSENPMAVDMNQYFIIGIIILGIIVLALGAIALIILRSLPEDREMDESSRDHIYEGVENNVNYGGYYDVNYNGDYIESQWKTPAYSYIPIIIVMGIYIFYNYMIFTL